MSVHELTDRWEIFFSTEKKKNYKNSQQNEESSAFFNGLKNLNETESE